MARRDPEDRPRRKRAILDCEPWILVTTRLRRRFVYNSETDESFWKFPKHVMLAVITMEKIDRDRKMEQEHQAAAIDPASTDPGPEPLPAIASNPQGGLGQRSESPGSDEESYEEVEVTDDEDPDATNSAKRHKTDDASQPQQIEFDEDDIAYQLAAMGEDYGLDPEEYDAGEEATIDGEAAGLPLSDDDAQALFRDMLDDYRVNPYKTWESVIERGEFIEDSRYTVLPNIRARREAFSTWSGDRIREIKENRAHEEQKDPRVGYMRFLHNFATPKLYWPEFRRKYKKEPEMRDAKLADKEREKIYREHISRLKLPESVRKSDLGKLLRKIPLGDLNRSSTLDTLPHTILTDIRFISLPSSSSHVIIQEHINTLDEAPELEPGTLTVAEMAEQEKTKLARQKREHAMAERTRLIEEGKRKQQGNLRRGKELMRENEREIEDASKIGREGILAYLDVDDPNIVE